MKLLERIENFYKNRPGFCFWALVILLTLPVSFIKIYDIDIWWHMQCGRSILESWTWPDFSTFYFSPVTQSTGSFRYTFLGEIVFHLVYLFSGDLGLQMIRLGAVLCAVVFFRSMAGKEYRGWHLLLIFILIAGTYQKQLVRNSLFACYLVPVIFWLWHQTLIRKNIRWIWLYPIILGLWSCLHGSYLLGFCLTALILCGDLTDKMIEQKAGIRKSLIQYGTVLLLSFCMISAWNPSTLKYLKVFKWGGSEKASPVAETRKEDSEKSDQEFRVEIDPVNAEKYPELLITAKDFVKKQPESVGFFYTLKKKLNNTIFHTADSPVQSSEFMTPFDALDRPYLWIALLSGCLGVYMILFVIRPLRLSLVLPFAGITFVGLGYLRLTGYIPMATAALVFSAAGENRLKNPVWAKKSEWVSWGVGLILVALLWGNCMLGFPVKLGTGYHAFGIGRVPTYSTGCPDAVISGYDSTRIFTTMTTGGYLLYRWFPHKKVFADGLFVAHPPRVMLHLRMMREKGINPDFLHVEYGIDAALVDHTSGSIMNTFFNSENWYPRYIDTGMVFFIYEPDFSSHIRVPEVLFKEQDLDSLPPQFRQLAVNSLHTIINALYKKGRSKDAKEFVDANQALLDGTRQSVDEDFLAVTEQLRLNGLAVYGTQNSKAQYYEYKHNAAVENGDVKNSIKFGQLVLKSVPDRYPVIMNLAIAYLKLEEIDQCIDMLERLDTASESGSTYLDQNRRNIAKFYWELSKRTRGKKEYRKSLNLAQKAHRFDPALILSDTLYQAVIEDVGHLNKQGNQQAALELLQQVQGEFFESGRWLNDMAWQLLITGKGSQKTLEMSERYAVKAVETLEKKNSTLLDLAYDTLAEIMSRKGNKAAACHYIEKALSVAPPGRKAAYQNRTECAGTAG